MNATVSAPTEGRSQKESALARANRVRLARARLKRRVGEGEVAVADVVADVPWEAESMRLAELLQSQHRWGRTRCERLLSGVGLAENKTVGSLTGRQRGLLAEELRGEE